MIVTGNNCELVNCANDPSVCGIYIYRDQCSVQTIGNYCPKLCQKRGCVCGIDECLNGGVFDPSSCKCNCPTGFTGNVCQTKSTCTPLKCQNNGEFNSATCKCDCFPQYSGSLCETLNCNVADSRYCFYFQPVDCATVTLVRSYCPHMCGRCLSSTTMVIHFISKINYLISKGCTILHLKHQLHS